MKNLKLFLLAAFFIFATGCTDNKDDNAFEITVTGGENFPEGARVLIYRLKTEQAPEELEYLLDQPFENGRITFAGTVDDPHAISMDVAPADSNYPLFRVHFVLEAGKTDIDVVSHGNFTFKGGRYNELLVNSWNENKEYKTAFNDLLAFNNDVEVQQKYESKGQVNGLVSDLKRDALTAAIKKSNDPMVKLLAFGVGYGGESRETAVQDALALSEQLAGTREAQVANWRFSQILEMRKARMAIESEAVIKDFTAQDLSGKEFHLKDVLTENKYVLVEFWASWCGPCRAEIPHMKTAYQNFKDKGFEIVSFTLDDDREAWEEASEEEQMPWINTGDLLAYTSPVAKMYGVSSVPANYLVEAATGKIVASHLRQDKLDKKLEELLGH